MGPLCPIPRPHSSTRTFTFVLLGPCAGSHPQVENHSPLIIISQTRHIPKMQFDCILPHQPIDPWAHCTGDVFPQGSQRPSERHILEVSLILSAFPSPDAHLTISDYLEPVHQQPLTLCIALHSLQHPSPHQVPRIAR